MTQLEYYTSLLSQVVTTIAIVGGLFSLAVLAIGAYYLYPWLKK